MRQKLALAAALTAAAATFGPVSNASAVCIDWYYELTGSCSPCNDVGAVLDRVPDEVADVEMHCLA